MLSKATDFSSVDGLWFKDFRGSLSDDGSLTVSFTMNAGTGGYKPRRLRLSRELGSRTLPGRDIEYEPGYFDAGAGILINVRSRRLD